MIQWRPITITTILVGIIGISAWGLSGLTKHIIIAVDRWGDAAPSKGHADSVISAAAAALPKADAVDSSLVRVTDAAVRTITRLGSVAPALNKAVADTADNINRPCRGKGGPDACGTLAQANKTMVRAGDAIVTTQLVERDSIPHVIAAMDAFRNAGLGLKQNSEDLNAILKDQAIQRSMNNFASISESWAGISADGKQVADKATADYLKPVRWYMQPVKRGGELIDITAAAARHIP